jgi:hypothetical protein
MRVCPQLENMDIGFETDKLATSKPLTTDFTLGFILYLCNNVK